MKQTSSIRTHRTPKRTALAHRIGLISVYLTGLTVILLQLHSLF